MRGSPLFIWSCWTPFPIVTLLILVFHHSFDPARPLFPLSRCLFWSSFDDEMNVVACVCVSKYAERIVYQTIWWNKRRWINVVRRSSLLFYFTFTLWYVVLFCRLRYPSSFLTHSHLSIYLLVVESGRSTRNELYSIHYIYGNRRLGSDLY